MNAFIVEARNQPGELAKVTKALGDRGINISTGAVIGLSSSGGFGFLVNDEAGARSALEAAGIMVREVPVVSASVADEPGGLASLAQRLADAAVNIELILPTGMGAGKMTLAIGVDNVAAARSAIGEAVGAA